MAATPENARAPRKRTDSFQRMLDLEKEYKLARLQSAQTSPQPESPQSVPASATSCGNDAGSGHDSEEEKMSQQSSICQSPSWEGYGQRKEKKKREKQNASQMKRSKVKEPKKTESVAHMSKDPKTATKKRQYNKLQKTPPPDNHKALSMTAEYQTSTNPNNQLGIFYDDLPAAVTPAVCTSHRRFPTEKSTYPPTSSRTHILKATLLPSYTQLSSSAAAISSPGELSRIGRNFSRKFSYNTNGCNYENPSDQSLHVTSSNTERGRQTFVSDCRRVDHGRRSRTRSIERSVAEFVGGAASTIASIIPASRGRSRASKHQSLGDFPLDQQKREEEQSSEAYVRRRSAQVDGMPYSIHQPGVAIVESGISIHDSAQGPALHERLERNSHQAEQQSQLCVEQKGNEYPQELPMSGQKTASLSVKSIERECHPDADHLGNFSKPCTPVDLPLEASTSGLLLAMRSHAAHRERAPSEPPPSRNPESFRDRAMRALCLFPDETSLVGAIESCVPGQFVKASLYSSPEIKDTTFRPSEASSDSSYCGNSCTIPSPTTTPSTSRPQSEKGTVGSSKKSQTGDTKFMSSQDNKPLAQPCHHKEKCIREVSCSGFESCGPLNRPGSPDHSFERVERLGIDGRLIEAMSDASNTAKMEAIPRVHSDKLEISVKTIRRQHSLRGQESLRHTALRLTDTVTTAASPEKKHSAVSTIAAPMIAQEEKTLRLEPVREVRRSHPRSPSSLSKVRMFSLSPVDPPRPEVNVSTPGANGLTSKVPTEEPGGLMRPMEKLLVECCQCRFLHDMPLRVYECMAHPDAVVTDPTLGISGEITTMVKCPWCLHNMSTKCCAGYASLVYLQKRLH